MANTKQSLLIAEKVFFDYMGIEKYPKHRLILNSLDIVQMIANGIELAQAKNSNDNVA